MSAARPATGRRAALTTILVVLVVAIPVAVFAWGRTTDSFAVKRVAVSGERRLPEREIRRLLTARFVGENLFGVGADDVRATLSRYPYVADVDVDRDFPDTLRIKLTEHEPAALLLGNGAWYVLSSEGRVLAQLDAIDSGGPTEGGEDRSPAPGTASPGVSGSGVSADDQTASDETTTSSPVPTGGDSTATTRPDPETSPSRAGPLPVPARTIVPRSMRRLPLMETDAASIAVGETVGDESVTDSLTLLASLPAGIGRRVAAVKVGETSTKAFLRDGLVVEFGSVDDLDVKVLALQAVIARYRERRVRPVLIDVSVPSRPLGAPVLPTPATR